MAAVLLGVLSLFGQVGLVLTLVAMMNDRRDLVLGIGSERHVPDDLKRLVYRSDWLTMWTGSCLAMLLASVAYAIAPSIVASIETQELKPLRAPTVLGITLAGCLSYPLSLAFFLFFCLHLYGGLSDRAEMLKRMPDNRNRA